MNELQELYQQVILDHNKNPRNFGEIAEANRRAEGFNPLCGDNINIALVVEGDVIRDVKFSGSGCAISKASASIMTTLLKGKTVGEAEQIFEQFHDLVTDEHAVADPESLGKMAVFAGVREFPARVKCASLCWHTMKNAIADKQDVVSTE
jgi:nitrogen fixation NifU-like protein